jgi:hypothetical protein
MDQLLIWVERENNDDEENDVVPEYIARQVFLERIDNPIIKETSSYADPSCDCSTLVDVTKNCIERISKLSCTNISGMSRARAALRLVIAVAIHCRYVDYREISRVLCVLTKVKDKWIDSERRFVESGGNCSHAGAFPFPTLPTFATCDNWRKRVPRNTIKECNKPVFGQTSWLDSSDMILLIMSFCDIRTLSRVSMVSKVWNNVERTSSNLLWGPHFLDRWPDAELTNACTKQRFKQRLDAAKQVKVSPRTRNIPKLVYCPICDISCRSASALKKHSCKRARLRIAQ